jgi:hypothetical protein
MPEPKFVTFREQTTGRINDLLIDEHGACAATQNLLSYLAGALLNYKEEGIEFTPSVVLCDSIEGFLKAFPGAVFHLIGNAPLDPSSGPRILKECAPISNRNWFIFIERSDKGHARYGVFTYFRSPTAIPLHEGITIDPTQFAILTKKVSSNTIEMRGAKGSHLTLVFSTVREGPSASDPIDRFSAACCAGIADNAKLKSYFARVLEDALTPSHGAILVCGGNVNLSVIPEMHDPVLVLPELDFKSAFAEYQSSDSAGSILNLQRCEELLQGFIRCDGIVIFDTCGRVIAYRVFFRPGAGTAHNDSASVGGTRRRAFEGIKAMVGTQFKSVLFRSQDGLTLYHGVNE